MIERPFIPSLRQFKLNHYIVLFSEFRAHDNISRFAYASIEALLWAYTYVWKVMSPNLNCWSDVEQLEAERFTNYVQKMQQT